MMHSIGFICIFLPLLFVWLLIPDSTSRANRKARSTANVMTEPKGISSETRLYRLAKQHRGRLTVSEVVINLGISVEQAERILQSMTDGLRVRMEVTDSGAVVYDFPELRRDTSDNSFT